MAVEKRFQCLSNIRGPRSAFPLSQINENVHAFEDRRQLRARFIQKKHQVMKALGADPGDSNIDGKPVAGAHFSKEMYVVFEIH